jgi:hypothetical protein
MANQTAEEIAAHYVAMGHSVVEVNSSQDDGETSDEFTARKARNVEHLVIQKAQVHDDDSSWWTDEDMTDIDAAIAS